MPTIPEKILADLAQRYPNGYLSFSKSGKRLDSVAIYRLKIGHGINVNGTRHVYDHQGRFIEYHGVQGTTHEIRRRERAERYLREAEAGRVGL